MLGLFQAKSQYCSTMISTPIAASMKKMETLNFLGTVSASAARICTVEDSHMGMIHVLKEFEILLETMQSEHEEMLRKFPGLPEEFNRAKPALLNLEDVQASSSEEE